MLIFAAIAGFIFVSQPVAAKAFDRTAEIAGVTVHYKVVLPKDYDAAKAYPGILAFPPGSQTMDMVMTTLTRNWQPEAERRGYIVVIPAAPRGELFFEGGSKVFPAFIDQILKDFKIRDNKLHIAGMSNGGISAFYIAARYPQYFLTVTGFPGYLDDESPAHVAALAKMCIFMHAGELDSGWREDMQKQSGEFRAKGYKVKFTVEKGESHVLSTLAGPGAARLFDDIESCK